MYSATNTEDFKAVLTGSPSLVEAVDKLALVQNKNVVLFLGATGSGKSTLINYALGLSFRSEIDEEGNTCLHLVDGTAPAAKMGTNVESCTLYPQVFDCPKRNIAFCDLPGFFDTRGMKERIITNMSIDMVAKGARQINGLVIVIEHDALYGEKARGFKKLMDTLRHLFKDLSNRDKDELLSIQNAMMLAFNLKGNRKTEQQIANRMNTLIGQYANQLKELNETRSRLTEASAEMDEAIEEAFSTLAVLKLIKSLQDAKRFVLVDDLNQERGRHQLFAVLDTLSPISPHLLSFNKLDPAQQEMNAFLFKIAGEGMMCMTNIDLAKARIQECRQALTQIKADIASAEQELKQVNSESSTKIGEIQSRLALPQERSDELDILLKAKLKEKALLQKEVNAILAELEIIGSEELVPCFYEEHEYSMLEKGARFIPGLLTGAVMFTLSVLGNIDNPFEIILGGAGAISAVKAGFQRFNHAEIVYQGMPFKKVELSRGLKGRIIVQDHDSGIFRFSVDILGSDSGKHFARLLTEKRLMPGNSERFCVLMRKLGRNVRAGSVDSDGKESRLSRLTDEIASLQKEQAGLQEFLNRARSDHSNVKVLFDERKQALDARLRESNIKLQQTGRALEDESVKLARSESSFRENLSLYQLLQKIGAALCIAPSAVVSEDPSDIAAGSVTAFDSRDEFTLLRDFLAALNRYAVPAASAPVLFGPAAGGAGMASSCVKSEIA